MTKIFHHTHYIEIHGFDAVIEISQSEHQRLDHRKLFPEVTKEELKKIANAAHDRTEHCYAKSLEARAWRKKYDHTKARQLAHTEQQFYMQYLSFSESFGKYTLFEEQIRYNHKTGSFGYLAYFVATQGHTLPVVNIEGD